MSETDAVDRPWTPEEVERLKGLLKAGLSAAQIAMQMPGRKRNAIIGKVSRMKQAGVGVGFARSAPSAISTVRKRRLTPSLPPVEKAPAAPGLAKVPAPKLPAPTASAAADIPARVGRPKRVPKPYVPGVPASIIDVTGCRFAVSEDASVIGRHLFCNAATEGGERYCGHHAARVVSDLALKKPLKPSHVYTARR